MKEYLLIDGNNLAYRSHIANFDLKNSEGNPSGMFFGFIRTLMSLKKKYRHFTIVMVWDGHAKHKYDIQPDYKADRIKLPGSVWSQIDDIKEFLSNIGVSQYRHKDQEADDVIATLTEKFKNEAENTKVYIYSNDKDLLQLVEDGKVIVYKPKVNNSPEKFYDEEAVRDQFGVPPKYLACYRSFDGDQSDNIKGVPRVPRKIIAKAVNEYKDVEGIFKNINNYKLTDFQVKAFSESKEKVENNFRIIELDRNIRGYDVKEASFSEEKVKNLLNKFNVKSIKSDEIVGLFSSTLSKKFTDPSPSYRLEDYSLFE